MLSTIAAAAALELDAVGAVFALLVDVLVDDDDVLDEETVDDEEEDDVDNIDEDVKLVAGVELTPEVMSVVLAAV